MDFDLFGSPALTARALRAFVCSANVAFSGFCPMQIPGYDAGNEAERLIELIDRRPSAEEEEAAWTGW